MAEVVRNLDAVRQRITAACVKSGRSPDEVRLLAVSKTILVSSIQEAYEAGQLDFGESRQQEAKDKIDQLPDQIRWHFIGKLQRNKARKVVAEFDCLHSIDSLKLASHVDRIAGELGVCPEVFLEVNLAEEESKGGFLADDLRGEADLLCSLSNLSIQGLMVIPPVVDEPDQARPWFIKARELQDELCKETCLDLHRLSMGMSSDFEVAIEEGSSIVRVGSAIFGGR